ncbi:ammonium transporter [Acetobacter sicerae]|uniref:Ammonium transporter n=1 Tax=Acetobacter sicerae TaxID=85325 RepID=A0ABS8VUT7_9PROT|nr:ammonium transporter [Acetobacter sicerae]MCE0742317.1 ammonium transporter [Acetobacter sicerae]NHN92358.1 ammonium transporter [Acetobacter sicerae]
MPLRSFVFFLLCSFLLIPAAFAADTEPAFNTGDMAWILSSTIFVFFMLFPGICLFYGGMIRKKNVLSMCMQGITAGAIISLIWFICGYSLIFTAGTPFIGGFGKAFMQGVTLTSFLPDIPNLPEIVFAMFELTFIAITPVIVLGATVERFKFSTSMVFMALWAILIYCPVGHMAWGPDGFLASTGALDFAGGLVVHVTSGSSALIASIMLGRRKSDGINSMAPSNMVLTVLGGCLLWGGWFGFNGGSALGANATAGMALLNSQIAACAALVAWVLAEWKLHGKPSLLGAISGAIAGLVIITPGCGFVTPTGAMIMGAIGGVVCLWAVNGLKHRFGYDDALDVWGIHGVGGGLGAILTGIFASSAIGGEGKDGLLYGNWKQVIVQSQDTLLVALYTMAVTGGLLFILDKTMGLRVEPDVELEGLDLAEHGETLHV